MAIKQHNNFIKEVAANACRELESILLAGNEKETAKKMLSKRISKWKKLYRFIR